VGPDAGSAAADSLDSSEDSENRVKTVKTDEGDAVGIPATGRSAAEGIQAAKAQTQTIAPAADVDAAVPDEVMVRIPADGAYLSVLRTATAGLAARLDFTLDEIDDMRIAVDEACAMILGQAIPGSGLECRFSLGQDSMTIAVSVHALTPRAPTGDTFAWTVLLALAGSVDAEVGPGDLVTVVLRKSRDSSRSP
jgi:serine/threonine-protein kinase RsbW